MGRFVGARFLASRSGDEICGFGSQVSVSVPLLRDFDGQAARPATIKVKAGRAARSPPGIHETTANEGGALVAIMPNDPKSVRPDELGWTDLSDSFGEMKIRAKDRQYNFPYLYDGETESVSRAYGPAATPHAFAFDAARKLRYVGAIDDSERIQHVTKHYLRDALDALLGGKEPPVAQTKVVGCSIKWAGKEAQVKAYMEKLINAFDREWQGQVPYTVLISPEGKIVYRETGSIDSLAVKRAIQKAMNERKPW